MYGWCGFQLPGRSSVAVLAKRALVIFVKSPVKGKVKTRLAATLGDDAALQIYHRLLEVTAKAASDVDAKRYLFVEGQDVFKELFPADLFVHRPQPQGDLGARMKGAFHEVFNDGLEQVVIIGSDLPDLTSKVIEEAFSALNDNDIVFGPATDGGYYLMGMTSVFDHLFDDLPWSTDDLLAITKSRIIEAGNSFVLLEERNDIDTEEDLRHAGWLK